MPKIKIELSLCVASASMPYVKATLKPASIIKWDFEEKFQKILNSP